MGNQNIDLQTIDVIALSQGAYDRMSHCPGKMFVAVNCSMG